MAPRTAARFNSKDADIGGGADRITVPSSTTCKKALLLAAVEMKR